MAVEVAAFLTVFAVGTPENTRFWAATQSASGAGYGFPASFHACALRNAIPIALFQNASFMIVSLVKPDGRSAEAFSRALYDLLYGKRKLEVRFSNWVEVIAKLARKQTRVLTRPVVTVFGFLARPDEHFFFKPTVTKEAPDSTGPRLTSSCSTHA